MLPFKLIIVGAVFLISNCQVAHNQEEKNMSGLKNKLKKSIEEIDKGVFEKWGGLGAEWSFLLLDSLFEQPLSCMSYEFSGLSLLRCEIPLSRQSQPLQCFINQKGEVILLRLEDAKPVSSWLDLQKTLGDPDQKNALNVNQIYAPSAQHIYAKKGLTVYVMELVDAANSYVSAISFYDETTAGHYLQSLGGNETRRYFNNY